MENNAVKKINTIGKIGFIVTKIMRILMIIGVVCCFIGATALFALPDDLFNVVINGKADIGINVGSFGVTLSETEQKSIEDSLSKDKTTYTYDDKKMGVNDVKVNEKGFTMSAEGELSKIGPNEAGVYVIVAIMYLALVYVTCVFAGNLSKALRDCGSPFSDNVIKKMKALAFSLISWAVVPEVLDVILSLAGFSGRYTFSINFGTVLIVLIIISLVYIFQYGAKLQAESDETL